MPGPSSLSTAPPSGPPDDLLDELGDALRSRGLRVTPQRRFVLDALGRLGHATPDQLCDEVQRIAPSLSPSTVYRALELLEDLGLVARTHLGRGAPSYSIAAHADHIHLVCRRCGSVQSADAARARPLAEEITSGHGFVPDLGHLSLHGLCAACAGRDDAGAGAAGVPQGGNEPGG